MIDKFDLCNKAINLRLRLDNDLLSPIDIDQIIQKINNLTVIYYPLKPYISGACITGTKSSVIVINSTLSLGHQRFTFAHELYHLYFEQGSENTICQANLNSDDLVEKRANTFASYFLLPSYITQSLKERKNSNISLEDLLEIEQKFGISRTALLFRLEEEGILNKSEKKKLNKNVRNTAISHGYNIDLYLPSPENQKVRVDGYLIPKIQYLYESGLLSISKYEELLLHAFREDLVYGDLEEINSRSPLKI